MSKQTVMENISAHRDSVAVSLHRVIRNLTSRIWNHDRDKYIDDELVEYLAKRPAQDFSHAYGSQEHNQIRGELKPILDNHYREASHHPEHFENGMLGMSLLDLLEMLADWKSANVAHGRSGFMESVEFNKERFNIPDDIYVILVNTIKEMEW